jgi:hypothetical protein
MKTPITDKFSDYPRDFLPSDKLIHADLARRLEIDRAALMEALEAAIGYMASDLPRTAARLRQVIEEARANFPTV